MKKPLSLLLCGLLLSSALLPACGGSSEGGTSADTGSVQKETTVAETEPDLRVYTNSTKEDATALGLDGYKFNVYLRLAGTWSNPDIYAEESTGDLLNDTTYDRNAMLEDRFGFTVTAVESATTYLKELTALVQAGDTSIDAAFPMASQAATYAQEGTIMALDNMKYLDLESSPWKNIFNDTLSIENRHYMINGLISVNSLQSIRVYYFSKGLLADNHLQDPYQLVRDGKWTLDALDSMAKQAAADLNGDGVMDITNDIFGMAWQNALSGMILYMATGEGIAKKDADDKPIYALTSERALEASERCHKLVADTKTYKLGADQDMKDCFSTKHSLFTTEGLHICEALRESDNDFGILPCPKLDETQEDYVQYVDSWCPSPVVVPKTVTDTDRTGFVLQILAETGEEFIRPVFYDKCLTAKTLRDEESSEMLDIIAKTYQLDLGVIYSWGGAYTAFKNSFVNSDGLASLVASYKTPFETAVADTLAKLEANAK